MDSNPSSSSSHSSLKVAVAVALLRSKFFSKAIQPPTSSSSSTSLPGSNAQRWKKKAKDRKQELLRLKQELRELEDGSQHYLFPPSASCKCYFFVRLKERRRRSEESVKRRYVFDLNVDYDIEQLSTSVDFLLELCKTVNPAENHASFANMSHQAVDFILVSMKKFAKENKSACVEAIVNSLITRLVGRVCTPLPRDESPFTDSDAQFCVQHLLHNLGADQYIGQRTMLAVSQRILVLANNLVFMDPFDDAFPSAHSCMFVLIQLIEFLISDYIQSWTGDEYFEITLFEVWLRSFLQARKSKSLVFKD